MKKIVAVLAIAAVLGAVGCSPLPATHAPASSAEASAPTSAAPSTPGPGVQAPDVGEPDGEETTAPVSDPGFIVQTPVPGARPPAAPTMSVDQVCTAWKQGFKVLNEGIVTAGEAMRPLEEATAAAPPEIRVQSGIATRIMWGQIMYPNGQPPSAETMAYLGALRQRCYDLTGIDVVEGLYG